LTAQGKLQLWSLRPAQDKLELFGLGERRIMKSKLFVAALGVISFFTTPAFADTLELKNGSVIKGTYVGGTETQISFRVGSTVQQYATADIASLKFDSSAPAVSAAPQPAAESTPAGNASSVKPHPALVTRSETNAGTAASNNSTVANSAAETRAGVTVPSGTRLVVRTIDAVDSDTNHPGDKFMASLEEPLYAGDRIVAEKGASVYGRLQQIQESGQLSGRAQLRLALTGIVIDGLTVPVSTGDYELSGKSRGASTAKKVGGGAALGAVIGAIAGGGKGAAIGAGVGAGAGTAVQVMTKGDQIHVPSETLLEFSLNQPISLPAR
jgi:hypothetical protein